MSEPSQLSLGSAVLRNILLSLFLASLTSLAACFRAPEAPPSEIALSGNDQMKYDLTAFEVKAGQPVKLTMENVGTLPKEAMGHNFVLLDKNTDAPKFVEAGQGLKESEYIAPAHAFHVLAKTKIPRAGRSGHHHLYRAAGAGELGIHLHLSGAFRLRDKRCHDRHALTRA